MNIFNRKITNKSINSAVLQYFNIDFKNIDDIYSANSYKAGRIKEKIKNYIFNKYPSANPIDVENYSCCVLKYILKITFLKIL